ncbi:tetratricopeptide repeat protein [Terricaulis silvestris]|uniref:Lipoprotein NlpI n=1 Tax=Terricaulis silvestris TaxID=2686094 RepID=A0A6I6MTD6_9CAUL|nr:tetratricopeptide repeat protein [Terricaulis silvestris]QGZ95804.1 lipoprotein NlpI [Terricaulis silvestris]
MTLLQRLVTGASVLCLASCASFKYTYTPPAPPQARGYADHLVGRVANLRQDHAAAADRYFAALARDSDNAALVEGAVTASLAAGDLDRAREAARMAPRNDVPAYARLMRASDAMAAGRIRQAGQELSAVEGTAAQELTARMLQTWVDAAENRVDNVVTDLAPFASIRPYGGLFTYQQALALDYAGRSEEALAAYQAAATNGMFLPPAVARHAQLLARSGAQTEALALLQSDANRVNPELIAAAQRVEAGAPAAERLTPAQGAAIGLYGLAAIYKQENDETSALAALSLSLALDSKLDASRMMFAQIQGGLGNIDAAHAMLARIPDDSPYAAGADITEAWLLVDSGREDEALALARTAAATGDLRARRALADMHRNLRQYDQAEAIYSELIAETPNEWRLYFARGAARERQGRWPEAEADFQHALELSPEQPDVLNYLGYTWVDRGEHMQEGLAMIQRAAVLRPMSGAIIDSLGWAYFKMGDYALALENLERAIELSPADPTLNDHLGDIYWRLGRRIEARFQWQRALALEPDNAAAIETKVANGLPPEPPSQAATR